MGAKGLVAVALAVTVAMAVETECSSMNLKRVEETFFCLVITPVRPL